MYTHAITPACVRFANAAEGRLAEPARTRQSALPKADYLLSPFIVYFRQIFFMIGQYKNQSIFKVADSEPATDDNAVQKGNSLRRLTTYKDITSYYECQSYCNNNKDCASFNYDNKNAQCLLYRKEPFKEINGLTLDDCTEMCSRDDTCDYLSHTQNNKCTLFSREDVDGKSSVGNFSTDYAIYGFNAGPGVSATDYNDCSSKMNGQDFVFYPDQNYCIPKKFTNRQAGSTTIFFNKFPAKQYEAIEKKFDIDPHDTRKKNLYAWLFVGLVVIVLFYVFYYIGVLAR